MQPALVAQRPEATPNRMSSREVAELTGKRHDNVLRDIREMIAVLHSSNLSFVCEPASYTAGNGQQYEMLQMDKDTTICLLTGYDVAARMKVVQRWQALENQAGGPAIPKTLSQALLLAAQQAEQVERLQLQLTEAKPAQDFYAAVFESNDAIPIADAAKVLGFPDMGQNKLFEFLREKRVLMSVRSHWNMPYQEYVNRGYFKIVERRFDDQTGQTRISLKTLVYQKGLEHIRKLILASL